MAAADVLALVAIISNGQADQTAATAFYSDIINDWGALDLLTTTTTVAVTPQTQFTVPTQVRDIIAIIWDDTHLGKLDLRALESIDPDWREQKGNPIAYTIEEEGSKNIALYPYPFSSSAKVTLINSESRTDVPFHFELPLVFLILEREYVRESNHQDFPFATLCGELGRMLLAMVS